MLHIIQGKISLLTGKEKVAAAVKNIVIFLFRVQYARMIQSPALY